MATPLNIPKLGVAMTEGVLVEWLVNDGSTVMPGQLLYRLETDKVENEIESPTAGVLRQIGEPGETYTVGTLIGELH